MPPRVKLYLVLLFALVAVGCTTQPALTPTTVPAVVNVPPAPTGEPTSMGPDPTPPPYPVLPTEAPPPTPNAAELEATRTFLLTPKPTHVPGPVICGMDMAPVEEQEEYISTTLVVAPFGNGPGQLGYEAKQCFECTQGVVKYADRLAVGPQGNLYVWDWANNRIVQFDPEGRFVRDDIPTPPNPPYTGFLFAVDGLGRFYDFEWANGGGICFDDTGQILQEFFPKGADGLYVDAQGTVWITGQSTGDYLELEGERYSWATFPLGSVGNVLDEKEQAARERLGKLMPSGGIVIASNMFVTSRHFIYSEQGGRQYEIPVHEWLFDMDSQGYFMTLDSRYGRVHKYNPKGQIVASFLVGPDFYPFGMMAISQGNIYGLKLDSEKGEYRIERWGK